MLWPWWIPIEKVSFDDMAREREMILSSVLVTLCVCPINPKKVEEAMTSWCSLFLSTGRSFVHTPIDSVRRVTISWIACCYTVVEIQCSHSHYLHSLLFNLIHSHLSLYPFRLLIYYDTYTSILDIKIASMQLPSLCNM